MATSLWLKLSPTPKPTTLSITNRPIIPKSLKFRATSLEFPLASKIMVRNLSYSTSESCLKKEFSIFGEIAEVRLVKDRTTDKSKGYAFIQYTNLHDAMEALEYMDEADFDGRVIFVELARPLKPEYPKTSGPPPQEDDMYY